MERHGHKLIDNTGLRAEHYRGNISEMQAAIYYLEQGYQVYQPMVQQGWVDFVVDKGDRIYKVQVKTATYIKSGNHKYLQCRTRVTNKYKVEPKQMYDMLLIIYKDRVWEIPAYYIDSSNLSLDNTNNKSSVRNRWDKYEKTH